MFRFYNTTNKSGSSGAKSPAPPQRQRRKRGLSLALLIAMGIMAPAVGFGQTGPTGPTVHDPAQTHTYASGNYEGAGWSHSGSDASSRYTESDLNGNSNELYFKNFGFNIPAEAVIQGVEVEFRRYYNTNYNPWIGSSNEDVTDNNVRLKFASGVYSQDDKANTGTSWGTASNGSATYGGDEDLWGSSLTPADVNDNDFGLAIVADGTGHTVGTGWFSTTYYPDAYVYEPTITVYYIQVDTLTLEAVNMSTTKTYDGTTNVDRGDVLGHVEIVGGNPPDIILETGNADYFYADKNVNTGIDVGGSGFYLSTPSAAVNVHDYYLVDTVSFKGDITQRELVINVNDYEKCYDVPFTADQYGEDYFTVEGLADGDSIASVYLSLPNGGGNPRQPAGDYQLDGSNAQGATGTDIDNYDVTINSGILTAQPELRAYISGVANDDVCDGQSVSLNYALYGPGTLDAALLISRSTGSTTIPSDTFYLENQSAGTNQSIVLPDSLTRNEGNDNITYRFTFLSINSDSTSCVGTTDGQVEVTVYPVPELVVTPPSEDTVCSGSEVTFVMENPNNVNGATYKINADYNGVEGGKITSTGYEESFSVEDTFTDDALVNNTNEPITVKYTIFTKSGNVTQPCQSAIQEFEVVVNPTVKLGDVAITKVCADEEATITYSGMHANREYTVGVKHIVDGTESIDSFNISSDNEGKFEVMVSNDNAHDGEILQVMSLTDMVTGCSVDLSDSNIVDTFVFYPLPSDVLVINGVDVEGDTAVVCIGYDVEITVSGDDSNTYVLYREDGTTEVASGNVGDSTYTFMARATDEGVYYLHLESPYGCETVDTIYLKISDLPSDELHVNGEVLANNDTYITCVGTNLTLELIGEDTNTYELYHEDKLVGAGNVGDSAFTFPATLSDAGTYYLHLMNPYGCETIDTFNLVVDSLPTFVWTINDEVVEASNDSATAIDFCVSDVLELALSIDSGYTFTGTFDGGYTLEGNSDSSVSFSLESVAPGVHELALTVSNWNGCDSNAVVFINVHPLPVYTTTGQTDVLCNGSNTGTFEFSIENTGVQRESYTLRILDMNNGDDTLYTINAANVAAGGLFTGTQQNLFAGNYKIVVSNAYGCMVIDSLEISEPEALILNMSHTDASCTAVDGELHITPAGGVTSGNYTIKVNGPGQNNAIYTAPAETEYTVYNLGAGIYTVTLIDNNGCEVTQVDTILKPSANVVTTIDGPAQVDVNATASVTLSATGAALPVTYAYTVNGGTEQTVTSSATTADVPVTIPTDVAGDVEFVITAVTDANGEPCSVTLSDYTVEVVTPSNVDLAPIVNITGGNLSSQNTSANMSVIIYNIGTTETDGSFKVYVTKPTASVSIDFSGNSDWAVTQVGNFYVLEYTGAAISGNNGSAVLTATINLTSGAVQSGTFPVPVIITDVANEVNTANNSANRSVNISQ